ncbi:MAG: hypothetical protein Fur0023_14860 [Bacteroidia bacterium]
MTGLVDAKFRVHAHYRNQWNVVTFKPFQTALISADIPYKKWGWGLQLSNMRAGVGNYNVFQTVFSTAYYVPLDKNKFHNLNFGIQAGFNQKSVEYKLYTFDNQYVNKNGGYFDQSLSSGESFNKQIIFLPQLNAGLLYYYSKQQSRVNPFLGFSAFNLTRPKETFLGSNNLLPMRYYFHFGTRINLGELLYIIPKVLIMKQTTAFEQTYALDAGYYFKNDNFYLLSGLNFRVLDASVAYIGFKKENYTLKLGYDFNTSSLKKVSKMRGAFEISLTYVPLKNKIQTIKNCPRL